MKKFSKLKKRFEKKEDQSYTDGGTPKKFSKYRHKRGK